MSKVAYELRSQHKQGGGKPFDGGSFALPGGKTFDIGKALKKGKGKIATDDPVIIDRLDRIDALRQVPARAASGSSSGGKGKAAASDDTDSGGSS